MRYNFKPPLQPRLYCLCGTLLLRRLHLISLLRKYPIIAERLQANTTSGPASISAHRLIPGVGFTMISRRSPSELYGASLSVIVTLQSL